MKRLISMLLVLMVMAVFAFGCGAQKDAKIKCPKCGAVFTVDEGLAEIQKKGF